MGRFTVLDVTDKDIADLNDGDLRALLARLIEATLRRQGLTSAGVTWGGHQDAPDGGIDVRIEVGSHIAPGGYIPKPSTGFQIKKPAISQSDVAGEMRPGGRLRASVAELAERGGAYVIVSSGSNLTDSERARRLEAMRGAVADHPNAAQLTVDFFDRQRIATWVRDFPAMSPWVHMKVGRPMQGWRSYENWASGDAASSDEFFVDETRRLFDATVRQEDGLAGMPILAGLGRMRGLLSEPRKSTRLIGLSGVGKTRFVQALFDKRIGVDALDPAGVVYADLGSHPEPSPIAVATYLVKLEHSGILIVDNCPFDLHRQLTETCTGLGSKISVLTIEYDIRDDSPQGTDVFRLEAGTATLVTKVVKAKFPQISHVDAETIGSFSGGNSRVGLALANTVRVGDSLAGLSEEALFARLFLQRHGEDAGLLASAEALALVYSFDGETLNGADSELHRLALLAGCSPEILYRHAAELYRRGLMQKRREWRAVLPHAIANRLAKRALENIPPALIEQQLVAAPERLMKSYSRRLGYLHDSPAAVRIVETWLSPQGLIGAHIGKLSTAGMALLSNVAPVSPGAILAGIERILADGSNDGFFSAGNPHFGEFVTILYKIAYDPEYFGRCTTLLARCAKVDLNLEDKRRKGALSVWQSLFSPFLSGTKATASERLPVVTSLLTDEAEEAQKLGIAALSSALETFHFHSLHDFSFGSRSRDYGYYPATREEQGIWFTAWVTCARNAGVSEAACAGDVRKLFAQKLAGLWVNTSAQQSVEETIEAFSGDGFWEDGFVAVKEALWRCRESPRDEAKTRLQALKVRLEPRTLEDRIRLHALRDRQFLLETEATPESIAAAGKREDELARELGGQLVADPELLRRLLPAITEPGTGRRWQLGQGMAKVATNRLEPWSIMTEEFSGAADIANPTVLAGYLAGWTEIDPSAVDSVLEDASVNQNLVRWYPYLEINAGLGASSARRLFRALAAGAPVFAFQCLMYGRASEAIPSSDLANLLSVLADTAEGWPVAVDILAMRMWTNFEDSADTQPLIELGRKLLRDIDLVKGKNSDHHLGILASHCLKGDEGRDAAISVCQILADAFGDQRISFFDFRDFLKEVFSCQPMVSLDVFSRSPENYAFRYPTILSMFNEFGRSLGNPVSQINDSVILEWCRTDPDRNYTAAASSVPFSVAGGEGGKLRWSDLALQLLKSSPKPCEVLRAFSARFSPHSWSGSRAAIIEANVHLLSLLEGIGNTAVLQLALSEREKLLAEAENERHYEISRESREYERFE